MYRAKMICSNISLFNDEVDSLHKMFTNNAYPVKFFDDVLSHFHKKLLCTPSDISVNDDDDVPIIVLNVPYFGKCSRNFADDISKLISSKFPIKVRTVYSTFKIKSYFVLKCF